MHFYVPTLNFFNKKLRSGLSTESFSILLLFSIVMRTMTYCISIVIGKKVEYKFLIEEFLTKKLTVLLLENVELDFNKHNFHHLQCFD